MRIRCFVDRSRSRKMSRGDGGRVYIGDLGSGGSKPELEREFEKYGPLKSVWVARNPPGFAFIEFEDLRDAEDAVRDMDGKHVCGVRIRVEMAKDSSRVGVSRGRYGGGSRSRYDRSPPPRRRSRSPRYRSRSPPGRRYSSRSPSPYYRRRDRDYSPRR